MSPIWTPNTFKIEFLHGFTMVEYVLKFLLRTEIQKVYFTVSVRHGIFCVDLNYPGSYLRMRKLIKTSYAWIHPAAHKIC